MLPLWLQEAQISGTFMLGIGAAFLGIQQFRLGRRKFKLELYDRRYGVFLSIRELLISIMSNDKEIITHSLDKARMTVIEARFLVEDSTWKYIQDLHQTCWTYYVMMDVHKTSEIRPPTAAQWKNIMDNEERRRWLIMQIDDLGLVFEKYLTIDDIFGFGGIPQKTKRLLLSFITRTRFLIPIALRRLINTFNRMKRMK